MKRRLATLLPIILAACSATSPVLASDPSPTRVWANHRQALTSADIAFLSAMSRGDITDEQCVVFGSILMCANGQLEQAKALLPRGGPEFQQHIDKAAEALSRFLEHRLRISKGE